MTKKRMEQDDRYFEELQTENVEQARRRLHVVLQDTETQEHRDHRRLTPGDREAIRAILYELHRLHLAVSRQRAELEKRQSPKKQAHHKPVGARTQAATAHKTKEKTR